MVNFQVVKVPIIAPKELPLFKSLFFKLSIKQVILRQLKDQKNTKKKERCNALISSYCRPNLMTLRTKGSKVTISLLYASI
jgi:hypothetical protein